MARLADSFDGLAADGDALTTDAPLDWAQGRTLYGGMTAALCLAGGQKLVDAPLRSAQFLFVGPASGSLRLEPTLLRAGRSSSMVGVDCMADGALSARAQLAFGAARESRLDMAAPALDTTPPAPADCPAFIGPTGGFHDNFELRLAGGSPLVSGGASDFTVWVRYREPPGTDPTVALIALADALPPAAMGSFPVPAPISTVSWGLELAAIPANVDDWHLLRSSSEQSREGYSMQAMQLWDASGRLLLAGRQLVSIFF